MSYGVQGKRSPRHHSGHEGVALLEAAAGGHDGPLAAMLARGVDPSAKDPQHGNTALHEAAWRGHSRCVKLLCTAPPHARPAFEGPLVPLPGSVPVTAGAAIAKGATHLEARNLGGFCPLHLAAQNGHNQSVREILLAGADPDLQNNYGDTALHTACRYGHAGATRILLSAHCRPSKVNLNGDSALHIASAMGRRKLCRLLLAAGCDVTIRNAQGETARDIAVRKDLIEILEILDAPVAQASPLHSKTDSKSRKRQSKEADSPSHLTKTSKIGGDRKKLKNVRFEPSGKKWSPYGCHYFPDPTSFPKPKLDSLPTEPLGKGEQYFLDLAGNICKGPVGVGHTCYCAPFFKHLEDRMSNNRKSMKKYIDKTAEKIDLKVAELAHQTDGRINELTKCVVAERSKCKERHLHLEQWLVRGQFRASEGPRKVPPTVSINRSKSLELLDNVETVMVHADNFGRGLKDQSVSKSVDELDAATGDINRTYYDGNIKPMDDITRCSDIPSRNQDPKSSRSSRNRLKDDIQSPQSENDNDRVEIPCSIKRTDVKQSNSYNYIDYNRGALESMHNSSHNSNELDFVGSHNELSKLKYKINTSSQSPNWKSDVSRKSANDLRLEQLLNGDFPLEEEMKTSSPSSVVKFNEISDSVRTLFKSNSEQEHSDNSVCTVRKSVHEIVAQLQGNNSGNVAQPERCKRFSRTDDDHSESSDDEKDQLEDLNRSFSRSGFGSTNLDKYIHQNYENINCPTQSRSVVKPIQNYHPTCNYNMLDTRNLIPKDAYFHERPNRNRPYMETHFRSESVAVNHPFAEIQSTNIQNPIAPNARSRHPLCNSNVDLNMYPENKVDCKLNLLNINCYNKQTRSSDNVPGLNGFKQSELHDHLYKTNPTALSNLDLEITQLQTQLEQNLSIAQVPKNKHYLYQNSREYQMQSPVVESNGLDRLDRDSHNDSGYSTKLYGSSQGPSPSLSGNLECDNTGGNRLTHLINAQSKVQSNGHVLQSDRTLSVGSCFAKPGGIKGHIILNQIGNKVTSQNNIGASSLV